MCDTYDGVYSADIIQANDGMGKLSVISDLVQRLAVPGEIQAKQLQCKSEANL